MKTYLLIPLFSMLFFSIHAQTPTVEVGGQPNTIGLHVKDANNDGIRITDPTAVGLSIENPGTDGIFIDTPPGIGLRVDDAGNDGIIVVNSFDSGINVFGAGGHGGFFESSATSPEAAIEAKAGDDTKLDLKLNGHGLLASDGNLDFYLDENNNAANYFRIYNSADELAASISETGYYSSALESGGMTLLLNNGIDVLGAKNKAGYFSTQNTVTEPAFEINSGDDAYPDLRLDKHGLVTMGGDFRIFLDDNDNGFNNFLIYNSTPASFPVFTVDEAGLGFINKLRVGTYALPTGYQMSVDGKIICEEVHVELSGSWPDYVFKKDYPLLSIDELEAEIKSKGHLPGIPSAHEVEENGLEVGDMQKRLLEKIEELTLHVIELNKKVEALEAQIK